MALKVLAVTGIRSEYDILYPVVSYLNKKKDFNVSIAVCGAHLSEFHGMTANRIEADGFRIADKIDYLLTSNRKSQRPKGLGVLLSFLTQTVEKENPDFLLVVGDREESIATALVGNYLDVLTAHIAGGDTVYGNSDDSVRHAVSKLSHIHFTLTKKHGDILKKMGEEGFRIFNVGNPSLDRIKTEPKIGLNSLSKELAFDISDGNYAVLINHPLSSEKENAYKYMTLILDVLENLGEEKGLKTIMIYPNTDPGSYDILSAAGKFESSRFIKFYKNIPRGIFVNLLKNALVLTGNSSAGILEAPFLKLPVVNIGNRQKGRIHCGNVSFAACSKREIKKHILKACYDSKYRRHIKSINNVFGDGHAAEKIAVVLKGIEPRGNRWLIKKAAYQKGV